MFTRIGAKDGSPRVEVLPQCMHDADSGFQSLEPQCEPLYERTEVVEQGSEKMIELQRFPDTNNRRSLVERLLKKTQAQPKWT
jgi:hypothetical protein